PLFYSCNVCLVTYIIQEFGEVLLFSCLETLERQGIGNMKFIHLLPFKEMTFFKVRYLLISFILFFVAILVFVISGLANGLSMNNASAIINMPVHSIYLQKSAEGRIDRSHFTLDLEKLTAKSEAQPIGIQMGAISKVNSEDKLDITFMAVQPGSFLDPDGKSLETNGGNSVLLDRSLSQTIKKGMIVKDARSGISLKVVGFLDDQTFSHTPVALISLDTWEELAGGSNKSEYNGIAINKADLGLEKSISSLYKNGEWVKKDQVVKGIPGYSAEQNSLYMMLSFLIVIALFVLAAFFYIMTIQKTAQFGILKAIGAKSSQLVKSTIFQVIMLSIVSIAAAVAFTKGFMSILPDDIPFIFDFVQMAKFSGLLFIVSIFGSLLSVFNIVKADPIQAMGRVE
ncbi:ABC transporter permease, partial [Neobacillus sp. MER 74]|uniref:ABC transporter permease n=1 Tax=Neobacillus sp. MER 74 TaxID=2939566 RepID=UPI00204125FA